MLGARLAARAKGVQGAAVCGGLKAEEAKPKHKNTITCMPGVGRISHPSAPAALAQEPSWR